MTITVNGPNGVSINFPDGTDSATIESAMRQAMGGGKADYVQPAPPPGAMIHETGRSYVTGQDGKPEYAVAVPQGTASGDRDMMSAALQGRADRGGLSAGAMPVFQGLTSSFGDEAVSGAYGATQAAKGNSFNDAYNYAQEMQRQELEQQRAEHPVASTVGQIGGAVLQAPLVASKALQATRGMSLLGKAAVGAGGGALYGAVEGFGSGSGTEDRAKQAGIGGGVGLVAGGLAPVVSAVAGKATKALLDSNTVNKQLQGVGLNRGSGDTLMRIMGSDNSFGGQGAKNIAAAGPDAMLVDSGPTARSALDTAMQRGGPATRTARDAVVERATTAYRNLTSALDKTLGTPDGIETATTAIREGTKQARGDAYDAAYKAAINYSDPAARRLEVLLRRVPGNVFKEANDLMRLDGHQSQHILASIADDGSVTFQRMPDVRQIDYITRALKQVAQAGEGQGALGGQTPKGAAYENLQRAIRSTLKGLVPEYGQALDTAADPISRIQAMKLGRDLLNPQTARDVISNQVKEMTKAELGAVRQGLRSQIDEVLANVRAVASDPNLDPREAMAALKMLSSRAARSKMSAIMEPQDAHALFSELGRASKALELYAGVSRNSATFARTAMNDAVKQVNEPGAFGLAKKGKFLEAGKHVLQTATGSTAANDLARDDKTYQQIANALTQYRGPDAAQAMSRLTSAYQTAPLNRARAEAIGTDLGTGTGLTLYQLGRQYLDSRQR